MGGRNNPRCPIFAQPKLHSIHVVPSFGTRVLTIKASAVGTDVQHGILKVAQQWLGRRNLTLTYVPVRNQWYKNASASLSGLVCDTDAEMWFADPRGSWP